MLMIFSSCSSFIVYVIKDKIPVIEKISIDPESEKGDFVVYENYINSNISYILYEISDKTSDATVLKVKFDIKSNIFQAVNWINNIDGMYQEYRLDQNNKTVSVFIVNNNDRTKVNFDKQQNLKSVDSVLVLHDDKYEINTKAGSFICSLDIYESQDSYRVFFKNEKVISGLVRMLSFNQKAYDLFMKMDKTERQKFKSEDYIEMVQRGNNQKHGT